MKSQHTFRRAALCVAALLVSSVLSACGGGGGSSDEMTQLPMDPPAPAYVFFNATRETILRAPRDTGGAGTVVLAGLTNCFAVAADSVNRTIYYGDGAQLMRADEDGANPTVIGAGEPSGIDIDTVNNKVYWSDFNTGSLYRADLDGSNPETVTMGFNDPTGVAVDPVNNHAFAMGYNNGSVSRVGFDGTGLAGIITGTGGQPVGIAVDPAAGKIYFSIRGASIFSADLDGSNVAPLVTGQGAIVKLRIDVAGGKIYWADQIAEMTRRANLSDGSGVEDLSPTGSTSVWGLGVMSGS